MRIRDFLVQHRRISKNEAIILIATGRVSVNGAKASQKHYVLETDRVECDADLLQEPVVYRYYAFHKPRGVECTLNPEIENNLLELLPFPGNFFPIGRLDKASEGLLLITNNGNLYQQIALSEKSVEKEYQVQTEKVLSDSDLHLLATGVIILGNKKTRPAKVARISANEFNIVLTQGLNRQIRRMVHTLGNHVTNLKRLRISRVKLLDLGAGEFRELQLEEI